MSDFKEACIWHLAREMARGDDVGNQYTWLERTHQMLPEAQAKISIMTNLELLTLIGKVLEYGR